MGQCTTGEITATARTPSAPGSSLLCAAPWDVVLKGLSKILEAPSALLPGMDTSLCTQPKLQFPAIMKANDYVRIQVTLQPWAGPPSAVTNVHVLGMYNTA